MDKIASFKDSLKGPRMKLDREAGKRMIQAAAAQKTHLRFNE
jgi:hypothetical protein